MSISSKQKKDRLAPFQKDALFRSLGFDNQSYLKEMAYEEKLTFQEIRQSIEIIIDLSMWGEDLQRKWIDIDRKSTGNKAQFHALKSHWQSLKTDETRYDLPSSRAKDAIRKVTNHSDENEVLGMCPVASEKTVCCNLMTVDAVQGCGLGCSYCSIQTFYQDGDISIDGNLKEKLSKISLDPEKNYHIGSGQSSDSLAFGNNDGIIDAQLDFARKHPNIIFEFKTKTKNISHLLDVEVPQNIFVCWSLNPQVIIEQEEHGTASLEQRISSARKLADKGVIVGFHFHPIFYYDGWKKGYEDIVRKITSTFASDEIAMISMGTLTFIKSVIKRIREAGFQSKTLQMPLAEASGKLSFPFGIKEKIFKNVYEHFSSWHDEVFFYFCMEDKVLWEAIFGTYYKTNEAFEEALFQSVKQKMEKISLK
ncbi:MAG: hypothetical protein HN657_00500 [Candidatus Marinimicrobia bacterium]|jgi:spore photoproduct lyase|nr:hypothetical protein [Candidatus Neomarinimicrobiota bacterium]MBT3496539.1 hypothetical protein [Candidatus Neomarinimicrobiota bacterium]MBT3691758.1 hypothetical protein [Candidatus Neomarinimicrobiota bacterium]MBT3732693.1 hypothetical protein [Candidatus Neomarinimicrobiota bacterium]MBT4144278.1 hypothetical protein [Candidatus Neomarinimicrobiota bacterium]